MKLHPDKFNTRSISGYGPGWIALDGEKICHSLIISSQGTHFDWGCDRFEALNAAHFSRLTELCPELIVFGTGQHLRFAQPAWLESLFIRRIGVETMDTEAACRTYNILASEGRHVVAALLLETT